MKLLLDVHIPAAVVPTVRRQLPALDIAHIATWRNGEFRTASDDEILSACCRDSRVFVTYDLSTIPDLLRQWAEEERSHAGVIFGDTVSLPPENIRVVSLALAELISELEGADTTNLVRFLRRVSR